LVYICVEENLFCMMSIQISPEAEDLRNTIIDLIDLSNIDVDILMEALCALTIDYMTFYMDESTELSLLKNQICGVSKRS